MLGHKKPDEYEDRAWIRPYKYINILINDSH